MVHENITTSWVYEHYLIYLHLCLADCDCIISSTELEDIRSKTFKSLEGARCKSIIKEVYQEFIAHTDQEKLEYIKMNAARFLRTDSIRQRVIQNLENFIGNKPMDSEEFIMFRFIRMIINNLK